MSDGLVPLENVTHHVVTQVTQLPLSPPPRDLFGTTLLAVIIVGALTFTAMRNQLMCENNLI